MDTRLATITGQQLLYKWLTVYRSVTKTPPKLKLQEEVDEFHAETTRHGRLREGADVIIVVLTQLTMDGWTANDVITAVTRKLRTNITRRWVVAEDGNIHHVPDHTTGRTQ
ncbi:MAG: DUF550 domain-containing protein [Propionibacteriaceae bacterium]|nr:DUF550 domain-containing protein [Propionibacteriaceae bacterium]